MAREMLVGNAALARADIGGPRFLLRRIGAADVVSKVMGEERADGEFTTLDDVAQGASFLAAFPSPTRTGQTIVVGHGRRRA